MIKPLHPRCAAMRIWSLAVLLALILAGCATPTPTPSSSPDCKLEPALCTPGPYFASHHCIVDDVRPRVYAPDTPGPDVAKSPWKRGDFWTYAVQSAGRSFTSTLVYYLDIDQGEHYLVGSASAEEALDHALFSINPMLGRIHRSLYSPHESGLHADMFHFPLCEGSRWTTTFYDTTFDLTATRATLDLPNGQDTLGFRITGSADGSSLLVEYSPAVKWFTKLVLERTDGLGVSMTLTDAGAGKSGTFHFLRAQKDEVMPISDIPAAGLVVERSDGEEGPYDTLGVWIDPQRTTGTGKVEVKLLDPSGATAACVGIAGNGVGGALSAGCAAGGPLKLQVPYSAGSWRVTVEKGLLDQGTQAGGEIRLVSIYDRSGNV